MAHAFSRRDVLKNAAAAATLIAAPAIMTRPARAAEYELKLATAIPPEHPISVRCAEAAEAIRQESNGQLEIKVFPGYVLGSSTSIMSQLRGGAIDFATFSGSTLASLIPLSNIYNIAFIFKDYPQVWQAMDGQVGDLLRAEIGKAGIHVLPKHWDLGFRHVTMGTRPINTPSDLAGVKFRVPVAPLSLLLFKHLGAAPTSINFDELYTALQTKIVDGQENDLVLIESARLFEVQKYCSLTGHIWEGYYSLVNGRMWETIPGNLQDLMVKHFNAAAEKERVDLVKQMDTTRANLEAKGLIFNEVDRSEFKNALRKSGFYAECKNSYPPELWSALDSAVGGLS